MDGEWEPPMVSNPDYKASSQTLHNWGVFLALHIWQEHILLLIILDKDTDNVTVAFPVLWITASII